MRDVNHIVEEYRQSDIAKRMHLFIEFRELRGEFSKIDRNEGFVEFFDDRYTTAGFGGGCNVSGEKMTDDAGNEMWEISIIVGDEDGTYATNSNISLRRYER